MDPLKILEKEVGGKGHPDYPFLHKNYSISSGIPCQDFTGFIIDRIKENDLDSIALLLEKIGPVYSSSFASSRIIFSVSTTLDDSDMLECQYENDKYLDDGDFEDADHEDNYIEVDERSSLEDMAQKIVTFPFETYVEFDDPEAYFELRVT
jgi:hypothetical protein